MSEVLLIIASVITAAFGQIFIKYSTNYKLLERNWIFYVLLSILSSTVSFAANLILFKNEEMSKISPILTAASIVVVVTASVILFNDEMNMRKVLGVGFAVVSVILLARS